MACQQDEKNGIFICGEYRLCAALKATKQVGNEV